MSVALSTKGDIDSMMDHVNRSERRVADVANKVSTINRELAADVAATVRSLQFEDILSQLLSQTRQGLVDLQGITNESIRSEERRVGKECVSTCRSRGSPDT